MKLIACLSSQAPVSISAMRGSRNSDSSWRGRASNGFQMSIGYGLQGCVEEVVGHRRLK